ncbi:hypothetical protein PV05_03595 [Exophiala xenobiotica]|uniref:Isopenicillin N synthase-like Fe(2+) 2OG dioxygenase domain-containing protein n=1 Tax=Exophiala xenobiotica TaxID=348802 RepID=A0A0D2EWH3_9EURO|nr:uncharacterized protein PV05_03595 [Exophiala xenobiotica]KIW59120.1 hypothetical protein PV05_03595 [Exophiala xenobiotica]
MSRLKFINYPPIAPGSQRVGPHKGTLVVNIAQGFEAITGGICSGTTHRVQGPTSASRYSIPFFFAVPLSLTLKELKQSTAEIVAQIPASDDRKKRALDVPSEFISPAYSCYGEAQLRNRIISHPDVGQKWYPELYEKYLGQGRMPNNVRADVVEANTNAVCV